MGTVNNETSTPCKTQIKFTKLFINGHFVDALSGKTFETVDPRTKEVIARTAEGDKEDINLAVKAAREAFDHGKWPRMSGHERGRILMKFTDLIEQHTSELAKLDTIDGGKVFAVTNGEISGVSCMIRYYAGAADKIHGETLKMSKQYQGYTLQEPIGVVGQIIPWNFPSIMFGVKVSPALAVGCSVILKPAEQTPLSALYYAYLAKEAGIPDGVLNVVTGYGETAGAALSSHMDVDRVSRGMITLLSKKASAKSNLKPVTLELGGKSPLIIFDDANIDMAVQLANAATFFNKDHVSLFRKSAERAKDWKIGDHFDLTVTHGPQVDEKQYKKVLSYIEQGKKEGATVLVGGKPCGEKGGYYIEPTIFTDVKDDMQIARDEIFGPVMSLMKFGTMEEVIGRAYNTKCGLAAGVVTKDIDTMNQASVEIDPSGDGVGELLLRLRSRLPLFGKDQGIDALDGYLKKKCVVSRYPHPPLTMAVKIVDFISVS